MAYVENQLVEFGELNKPCIVRILLNERFNILTNRFIPLFNLAKCKYAFDENKKLYLNENIVSTEGLTWKEEICNEDFKDKIDMYCINIKTNEEEKKGTFLKILNNANVAHNVDGDGNVYINFKKLLGWGNGDMPKHKNIDGIYLGPKGLGSEGRLMAWDVRRYGRKGKYFGEK